MGDRPVCWHGDPDQGCCEKVSRPVSRVLSRTIIHLGYTSPYTSSGLPGNGAGHTNVPLFGLAPDGVCPAISVARYAVRSYRTISPLPRKGRYIFCGTFRRLTPPRRYLASCPVEPGLSSRKGDCPADSVHSKNHYSASSKL